jgi:hypothetical protein
MPNPLTLDDLLPILNLPCGDVLKAHLLAHFHPSLPKLNPIWLQGIHRGEAEAAAAAARKALEGLPAPDRLKAVTQRASADDALQAFKADHKPTPVLAKPGVPVALDTPVVVPVTHPSSVQAHEKHNKGSFGGDLGFGFKSRNAAIKAQVAANKAAGMHQAREEPTTAPRYPTSFKIDGEEWVTIKEAARRLGLKDQAVYYQCTNESVPVRPAPSAFNPLTKVYLWERVQAALASKKKPVDK